MLEQDRDRRLAAQIDAGEVHVLHSPPGVELGLEDRVVVGRRDPGVVEADVERAETLDGGRVHGGHARGLGDIGVDVEPVDFLRDGATLLVGDIGHHDVGSLSSEPDGARAADAARRARDDRYLALESSRHRHSPIVGSNCCSIVGVELRSGTRALRAASR